MAACLSALAVAAALSGAAAQSCVPLAKAAQDAGLTALLDAVTAVADVPGADELLDLASMTERLDEGRITLFAPTNDAFMNVESELVSASFQQIYDVLTLHVLPVELDSTAVLAAIDAGSDVAQVPTLLGVDLLAVKVEKGAGIGVEPANAYWRYPSVVVVADVETCVGTVHVIDKVLIPPESYASGSYGYGDVGSYA